MAGFQMLSDLAQLGGGNRMQIGDLMPNDYPQEVKDEAMKRAMQELQGAGMEGDERLRVKYFNQFIPEVMKEWQMQNAQ